MAKVQRLVPQATAHSVECWLVLCAAVRMLTNVNRRLLVTFRTVILQAALGISALTLTGRIAYGLKSPHDSVQEVRGTSWSLAGDQSRFIARYRAESGSGVEPFDVVVLRRTAGSTVNDCAIFSPPTVVDDGVNRDTEYSAARPSAGPCGPFAGARFAAIGKRGSTLSPTPAVP